MSKVENLTRDEHRKLGFEPFEPGYIDPKATQTYSPITKLSEREFAYDLFTFELKNYNAVLSGVYRAGILKYLSKKGYAKRFVFNNTYQFIREENSLLDEVEPVQMKDEVYQYLTTTYTSSLKFHYLGITIITEVEKLNEIFLKQSHLIFNTTFLEHLTTHTKPILKDTKTQAFFTFNNLIVSVIANSTIKLINYSELKDRCIWRRHILKMPFTQVEYKGSYFDKFLSNVCNAEPDRIAAITSGIGYLCHNYGNPSQGQAVIAYDEEITDLKHPQGGTGKGILKQAISQVRMVTTIDGKKFDERDRFCFQDVDETTQIVFFDDVRPDLGFERFFSILTEGMNIEKKMKQSIKLEPEVSPKIYITSNAIIKGEGTTVERRQFIIEFSTFYSKLIKQNLKPIEYTHGCEFFGSDWTSNDWNQFNSCMMDCVQYYLSNGLQYYKYRGLNANKLKQSTSDEFSEWVTNREFILGTDYNITEEFNKFKSTYYGEESDFKQRTFTNWLKIYVLNDGKAFKRWKSDGRTLFKIYNNSD